MLFKVIVICTVVGALKAEPLRMEPQFEAEHEDEVRDVLLPEWLENTGHVQAEGTDLEISEVEPSAAPEPEPAGEAPKPATRRRRAATASGPMGADGVQLPTLDEYVAAGYPAERYEAFIAARVKKPDPEAKVDNQTGTAVQPPALVVGESRNEWGAVYMGKDADGNAVWDPPHPPPADTGATGTGATGTGASTPATDGPAKA